MTSPNDAWQGWNSDMSAAPRDGTLFLVYREVRGLPKITVAVHSHYYGTVTEPGRWVIDPTHWMPLPPAPEPGA